MNEQILAQLPEWEGVRIVPEKKGVLIAGFLRGKFHVGHSGVSPDDPDDPVEYAAHLHQIALKEEKEVSNETIAPMAIDDGPADNDPGGRGPAGDRAGVSELGEDGAGSGGPGADRVRPVEAAEPDADTEALEQSPDSVAVEIEDRPALESEALAVETSEPASAGFAGGMMLEKDELRILKDRLVSDINYAAADRVDAITRTRGELTAEEVRLYNEGQITKETDLAALNNVRDKLAALILRENAIKAFATRAREGLEGKTLADLKTFDIAELPWPT